MDVTCSLERMGETERSNSPGASHPGMAQISAWFVPNLAVMVCVFTLFFCLFLFDGPQKLFRDSDTGWHIRTGESILRGEGFPHTDSYSLLRAGQPWFAWEWLADSVMAMAYRLDGLSGVVALYAISITACTWLWFRLTWAVGGNFLLAAATSILMLSTANIHWVARPHIFSWLFLLGALLFAERMKSFGWKQALGVAVASCLWANIHGSFFLGPIVALLYAFSFYVRPLIWPLERRAEWQRARWFLMAAGCAAAGSLINPYGLQLHEHVFRYLTNTELLDRIGEFQSFNFHAAGSFQILLTILVAGMGGVMALGERRVAHFLLSGLMMAMALRAARGLPLVALAVLPLANGAITATVRGLSGLREPLRQAFDEFFRYSDNLSAMDRRFQGWASLSLILALCFFWLQTPAVQARTGFPPDQFPVTASAEVERLPVQARLFAPDKFGGYLIYRFAGGRKVSFDGRSDFYGVQYMKDYIQIAEVRPGWREKFESMGFTHALLPNQYSLIPALQEIGWKRIYSDNTATLLEKGKR